jgi:hypothetical protein
VFDGQKALQDLHAQRVWLPNEERIRAREALIQKQQEETRLKADAIEQLKRQRHEEV